MHRPMLAVFAALLLAGCGGSAKVAPTQPATEAAAADPTAAPTEVTSSAVADYVLWTGDVVGRAREALGAASAAMRPAGADPSLLDDSEWLRSTGRELGKMVVVAREIEAYTDVPDEAKAMHAEMLTYGAHLSTAAKLLAAGLDDKDMSKVKAASVIMSEDMPATLERLSAERDKILPPK